jgi:NAD(P)-dependent dehydrogenase (short-subunit alcohol dehydrogenase family)
MPLDKWRIVIDTNLTGGFLFCQAVGRHMIERGVESIVKITSINALAGGMLMPDVPNAPDGTASSRARRYSSHRERRATSRGKPSWWMAGLNSFDALLQEPEVQAEGIRRRNSELSEIPMQGIQ